jgi:peptidoglycan/xylan/chitin deacetylase (PgdA/CDA1 family)
VRDAHSGREVIVTTRRASWLLLQPVETAVGYVLAHAARLSRRRVGLALVYHRVADPQGDPERELVPAYGARLFESHLRRLKACYRVVPASELLPIAIARRRGQRFPVAVTFDDDLRSHVEAAMPALRRHGLPATFFLCGASLHGPHRFWWERLQAAADSGAAVESLLPADAAAPRDAPAGAIHAVGSAIEELAPDERAAVARRLESQLGPDPGDSGIRAEDARTLAAAGLEIGFHTLRHEPLPQLDERALAEAMSDGRAALSEVAGSELTVISYPHGKADERVAAAARSAGYAFGFTTSGEKVRPGDDPLLLGRLYPTFGSPGRFALQVALALIARSSRLARAMSPGSVVG